MPLNGFTTSYEDRYRKRPVDGFPRDWLLGLPLLVELPGTGWAAITEADLADYAGMYLAARRRAGCGPHRSPFPSAWGAEGGRSGRAATCIAMARHSDR